MLKKVAVFILGLFIAVSFTRATYAGADGNKRKGKYTYRKVYKDCQSQGVVDSVKPPINPDSKTQAQWTRVFEKKDFDQFGCKEQWSKLSEQEILDIFTYLHSGAADSPTPAKCK